MKRFLLAPVFAVIVATTAFATPLNFYEGGSFGVWSVFGNPGEGQQNPACISETTWDDGSKFQLIKDVADGEIYIWFKNNAWNIGDAPGDYQFRMNFYSADGNVVGGDMNYTLVNKNTILVRKLDVPTFIPAFMSRSIIKFIMPGDIETAVVPLTGSTDAMGKMLECIDASKNLHSKNEAPEAPKQSL